MATFDQNNLSQLNFKFRLDRTPDIEYRAQTVQIPGMNLGTAEVPTPFVKIPLPGNISYDELQIGFLIGENMKDYLSIYDWMVSLGYPDRLGQYRDLQSDCSVFVLDSNLNPQFNVRFTDAYPVSLSGFTLDTTMTETQYATATVTFRYTRWYFEPI